MALNFEKIKNVSAETRSVISRKSAQTLPNNPSAKGIPAEEIKRRFYQPILDAANSALSEIDRVVNEANVTFGQVSDELDNFIETTKIKEAYKVILDNTNWVLNNETSMYELIITKDEHGIDDYKEIGVNMFLLDGNGKYIQVNQFEVGIDGCVRCFHETNGAGYISIYVKREGFIVGNTVVDADHVVGLSKVGKTNDYNDLSNKPNIEQMNSNEIMISKIISGNQSVNQAIYSEEAKTATYANTSGVADSANKAIIADKADSDQFGVNIHSGYAKQNGTYLNMTVGKSREADKAKADEDGVNIKNTYAKQNGTYLDMFVGEAKKAQEVETAKTATKAIADENGANISSTYAKTTGSYPNITVGKSSQTSKVSAGGILENGVTATTQSFSDNSDKVATTKFVHNASNSQVSFLSITFNAILRLEMKNGSTWECNISFPGYGIYVFNPQDNSYYWMGSIHGSLPKGKTDRKYDVFRVRLINIQILGLTIDYVINGGCLAHKESDKYDDQSSALFDTEGIKNLDANSRGNTCYYYAENPDDDWAFNEQNSYILISNFIVKLKS